MPIASELINILGFRIEGEQNLKRFKSGMDKAEKDAVASEKRFTAIGNRIGMAIGGAAIFGAAAIKKSYKEYAEIEERFARIGLNAGKGIKEVPAMLKQAEELAGKYGVSLETVTKGFDNLVAKGADVDEAFGMLPEILNAAQGLGADIDDTADSAFKIRDAFKLAKEEVGMMLDILGSSGQSGQFEFKDMSKYAPSLGNQYAAITGSTGLSGVKELSAFAQTVREDTATAGEAATLIENFLAKAYADQTIKAFKDRGINIRKEMAAQLKAGKEFIPAYTELLSKALKGDMSRVQEIFPDIQAQAAARSLLNSQDRYSHFRSVLDEDNVRGTAARNVNEVLDLQATKLQNLTNQWQKMWLTIGGAVSKPIGEGLDSITRGIEHDAAAISYLQSQGYSGWSAAGKLALSSPETAREYAMKGGWQPNPTSVSGTEMNLRKKAQRPQSTVFKTEIDPNDPFGDGSGAYGKNDGLGTIATMIQGMNANLARMTANATGEAKITDASQDNRDQSIKVSAPVTVYATGVTAPKAVGDAIAGGINIGAQQVSRIQQEPAQ